MNDLEKNINLYSGLVKEHGINYRSLNWGSKESQEKRFEVLSGIGNLSGKKILDVGCGIGDYYDWLSARYTDIRYAGIDITPGMIEAAQKRFPSVPFFVGSVQELNVTDSYDFIFASGIFTYLSKDPYEQMFDTIQHMFSRASVGIAFNSLCGWARQKDEGEFYSDPLRVIELCTSLSTKLIFRNDYHIADYSIYLFK